METDTATVPYMAHSDSPAPVLAVHATDPAEPTEARRTPIRKAAASAARIRKEYDIGKTFGIDLGFEEDEHGKVLKDSAGNPIPRERSVMGYEDEATHPGVELESAYIFPPEETKALLLGFTAKDRILITGDTGVGKTSVAEQIARRLRYNVVKLSFDGCITRQDLVGEWVVKGREMVFQYGVLVLAMQLPGTVIILDEWDTISGECSFVIQRPLQKEDGKLLLMETGGEIISMHPDNVIIATANTVGQGDDTGLYGQGTKVQNYAQLNRFSMTVKLKHLPEAKEIEMVGKRFSDLSVQECSALVKAINAVRDGYSNGQISAPLSTRDLINWADKYIRMGDPLRAAKYCFMNRMPVQDAAVTEQLIQRTFEGV